MSSSGNIVKLNIGGTVFQTAKSTLTRFDGFFKAMMETEIPVTKDDSGSIFIDRNPKHFGKILDFMRDGDVDLPKCELECQEICREAQYYLLEGLMEKCKDTAPAEISEKLNLLENDVQHARLVNRPLERPFVIIHYRTEEWNVVFCDTTAENFVESMNEKNLDVYFKKIEKDEVPEKFWGYKVYTGKHIPYLVKNEVIGFLSTVKPTMQLFAALFK